MSDHTPTPWHKSGDSISVEIFGAVGGHLLPVAELVCNLWGREGANANANHIIDCVNAFGPNGPVDQLVNKVDYLLGALQINEEEIKAQKMSGVWDIIQNVRKLIEVTNE